MTQTPSSPDTGITRTQALALLHEHIQNENLRKHGLAVEALMRRFALYFGEQNREEVWAIAGLLHDVDWEATKEAFDQHALLAERWILQAGGSKEIARAVKIHNYAHGIEPTTNMEKVLYYVEELSGIVTALALVHPEGIMGVKPKSVIKKLKIKSFAAGVNREVTYAAPEALGMTLEQIIELTIEAMQGVGDELGLTK